MLKGFYLTLLIGPAVPCPVPQVVLDALTERAGERASGDSAAASSSRSRSARIAAADAVPARAAARRSASCA